MKAPQHPAFLVHYDRAHRLVTLALEPEADTTTQVAAELIDLKLDELAYTCVALSQRCAEMVTDNARFEGRDPGEWWRELLTGFAARGTP